MSHSRIGKIARLPKHIRDQLGRRLEDGEPGTDLVPWLNSLEPVQRVLKERFGARPITEQNLSEWKQGGYLEWLRHQEVCSQVATLAEHHSDLEDAADGQEISDRFAGVVAAELARLAAQLLEQETDPEKRWQRLREIHRELSQLRRDDHRAVHTFIERSHWEREQEKEDAEAERRLFEERREEILAPMHARMMLATCAEVFGGGEPGRQLAAYYLEVKHGLRPGALGHPFPPEPAKPAPPARSPAESGLVQPNLTKSN